MIFWGNRYRLGLPDTGTALLFLTSLLPKFDTEKPLFGVYIVVVASRFVPWKLLRLVDLFIWLLLVFDPAMTLDARANTVFYYYFECLLFNKRCLLPFFNPVLFYRELGAGGALRSYSTLPYSVRYSLMLWPAGLCLKTISRSWGKLLPLLFILLFWLDCLGCLNGC